MNQDCNIPVVSRQWQRIRIERKYFVSWAVDDSEILFTKCWDRSGCQTSWKSGHSFEVWDERDQLQVIYHASSSCQWVNSKPLTLYDSFQVTHLTCSSYVWLEWAPFKCQLRDHSHVSLPIFLSFSMSDENSPPSAPVYALKLAKRKTPCVGRSVRYHYWPICCGLAAQEILLFTTVDILAEQSTPCATYMHWSATALAIWARRPSRKSHLLMSWT